MSAVAVSKGYLCGWPQPYFSASWGAASWSRGVGLLIYAGFIYSIAL